MKYLLPTLLLGVSLTAAHAQEPKEYTLKLDGASLTVISKALGAMPFNEVYGTIVMLQKQVAEQNIQQPAVSHVTPPVDKPQADITPTPAAIPQTRRIPHK